MSAISQEDNSPLLKQLSKAISADDLKSISGGVVVNTHYTEITVYQEDNGDGTITSNGNGGGTRPSLEITGS